MSRRLPRMRVLRVSFPRVSGDEPGALNIVKGYITFSPRERG